MRRVCYRLRANSRSGFNFSGAAPPPEFERASGEIGPAARWPEDVLRALGVTGGRRALRPQSSGGPRRPAGARAPREPTEVSRVVCLAGRSNDHCEACVLTDLLSFLASFGANCL